YAAAHPEVRGMGTTTTAVGVLGDHFFLSQVGDSRAYLIRQGQAVQLTKDQSLMQRLVEAGELTEEEAAKSERRNIILQALGPDARLEVELTQQEGRRAGARVQGKPPAGAHGTGALASGRARARRARRGSRALPGQAEPVNARFTFLSGARVGQVEIFRKSYIVLGRHPLSDVRFDTD